MERNPMKNIYQLTALIGSESDGINDEKFMAAAWILYAWMRREVIDCIPLPESPATVSGSTKKGGLLRLFTSRRNTFLPSVPLYLRTASGTPLRPRSLHTIKVCCSRSGRPLFSGNPVPKQSLRPGRRHLCAS